MSGRAVAASCIKWGFWGVAGLLALAFVLSISRTLFFPPDEAAMAQKADCHRTIEQLTAALEQRMSAATTKSLLRRPGFEKIWESPEEEFHDRLERGQKLCGNAPDRGVRDAMAAVNRLHREYSRSLEILNRAQTTVRPKIDPFLMYGASSKPSDAP